MFTAVLFNACKKEEKNIDLFEAEIDGVVYNLKRDLKKEGISIHIDFLIILRYFFFQMDSNGSN